MRIVQDLLEWYEGGSLIVLCHCVCILFELPMMIMMTYHQVPHQSYTPGRPRSPGLGSWRQHTYPQGPLEPGRLVVAEHSRGSPLYKKTICCWKNLFKNM